MFLANVDVIPNKKYEILGMVTHTIFAKGLDSNTLQANLKKMMGEVAYMGGNGIIGIKIHTMDNGGTLIVGTAIKLM